MPQRPKKSPDSQPIAIVGMALKVPGASTPADLWQNLINRRDCLTRPTGSELRRSGLSRRQIADPDFVRSSPWLDHIDRFDASFFDMPGFEAERTDPTHRLFLECTWEALERACIVPGDHGVRTAVFGGVESGYIRSIETKNSQAEDGQITVDDPSDVIPIRLGTALDFPCVRVSHKLNLQGPSFTVMAACATSLIAIHLSVKALRNGECDIAIAGGASINSPQVGGYMGSIQGMLSPTGVVRPFSADADGTVFGSGVGTIILRPLEDAIAAGNPIIAVIRGSGVSNDGSPPGKESFIAPSPAGQRAAVERALADSGIDGGSIGYLEAHGTATLLGDPVEINTISDVYQSTTIRSNSCALGSVKANVGHLRTAAGVISTIKACMALQHQVLPPLTNYTQPNPKIDLAATPFFINTEAMSWKSQESPRRAAVSSFGFGGTNAHVVLEEYRQVAQTPKERTDKLFLFSAKTPATLKRRVSDTASFLARSPETSRDAVARTLIHGRKNMEHRVCYNLDKSLEDSSTFIQHKPIAKAVAKTSNRSVVFLFPGQGSQYPGMGADLYYQQSGYRETIDQCAELLLPELGYDIRTILHPNLTDDANGCADKLQQTANAQPALFVVEYALASLFMKSGVKPSILLGHSIGEIVAACVANVFSLPDALKLVAHRAKLMQACKPGSMLAVMLPPDEIESELPDGLDIAALNAPGISIVAGPTDLTSSFADRISEKGVGTRALHTSHAFHSWMMDPALPEFRELLASIELHAPEIPIISNRSGTPLKDEEARDPLYWSDHVRQTVLFSASANYLLAQGDAVYLEVGPGRTLTDLIRQHDAEQSLVISLDSQRNAETLPPDSVTRAIANLWCHGASITWPNDNPSSPMVELPPYSFDRRRHWLNRGESETIESHQPVFYERSTYRLEKQNAEQESVKRSWLILKDEFGLGDAVHHRLKSNSDHVLEVTPGTEFLKVNEHSYQVRPDCREDFEQILADLQSRTDNRDIGILHLWSVTGNAGPHNSAEAFQASTQTGFHTLAALCQAITSTGGYNPVKTVIAADGLRQVDSETVPIYAEKGNLLGPVINVPFEGLGITMRLADIGEFQRNQIPEWLIDAIERECRTPPNSGVIALRAHGSFQEELYKLNEPANGNLRLRIDSTVLITGGTGALGLVFAKHLFDQYRVNLVLTARWAPPPRNQWKHHAAIDDKIGKAIKQIMELESRGAKVSIVQTDVSDLDNLETAIQSVEQEMGPISTVIHCAASNIREMLVSTDKATAERIFRAKVHGAFNLEHVFSERNLENMILLSSYSSLRATKGQSVYSSSNEVLNLMATPQGFQSDGINRCAIAFGAIEEVGMAANFIEADSSNNLAKDKTGTTTGDLTKSFALEHPLIKAGESRNENIRVYRGLLKTGKSWVLEHTVKGTALLPAVAFLECVHATLIDHFGDSAPRVLTNIAFLRPLFVKGSGSQIEVEFKSEKDDHTFEVRSKSIDDKAEWTVHLQGTISDSLTAQDLPARLFPPTDLPPVSTTIKDISLITFGERWDWECLQGSRQNDDTCWRKFRLPQKFAGDLADFRLHPAMFDRGISDPFNLDLINAIPFSISALRIYRDLPQEFYVFTKHRPTANSGSTNVCFVDDQGNVLLELDGLIRRQVSDNFSAPTAKEEDSAFTADGLLPPNHRIMIREQGDLDSFDTEPFEPRLPGPGEVQLDIIAAGLNFRNLLEALNMVSTHQPTNSPGLGIECSGIVTAVGAGLTDLQPGDPVIAMGSNAFSTSMTTSADFVAPLPSTVSLEQGAGIPIVFLTAEYALNQLAKLQAGERILIHAAAGGVGIAAIQIAKNIGAEIFATVGSQAKRTHLERLGITHIMNSRDLNFVEEIRDLTGGQGVDVVLNSLANEFIPANFEVLRYGGRFIEIGKRDIQANTLIGLQPFSKNLSYFAFDLGLMMKERDPLIPKMLDSLMWQFEKGRLSPPPTKVIPAKNISEGFQRMAKAEHIGKNVFKLQIATNHWLRNQHRFTEHYPHLSSLDACTRTLEVALRQNRQTACLLALNSALDEVAVRVENVSELNRGRPNLETDYLAPRNETEQQLTKILEKSLDISPIGIHDDFFELGGDSITAIQTQHSIKKTLQYNVPMTVLFEYPTVEKLAKLIGPLQ
ncbi:MAG: SDR family NAD(P)-dependent oxidoreductase [Planctomycetaceae bacterium]|nr:SDR family NAD(P)-dependent oxidoreductase [Planctomycetaceae bacterium]